MIDRIRTAIRGLTTTTSSFNEMDLTPWPGRCHRPSPRGDWSISVAEEMEGHALFRISAFTLLPFPEPSPHQTAQLATLARLPGHMHLLPDSGEVALIHEEYWRTPLHVAGKPVDANELAVAAIQRGHARVRTIGKSWEHVVRPLSVPPRPIGSC